MLGQPEFPGQNYFECHLCTAPQENREKTRPNHATQHGLGGPTRNNATLRMKNRPPQTWGGRKRNIGHDNARSSEANVALECPAGPAGSAIGEDKEPSRHRRVHS